MNPIETRVSTRTFTEIPLSSAHLEKITTFLENPKNKIGPFGHQIEFEWVLEAGAQEKEQIGTYGFIQNAQGYILGSSTDNTQEIFDYAYVLENIVLYLTSLNIGTCWLGGRFRKQEAMSLLSLADNKIIPAIITIGYIKEKPRLRDRMVRTVLKAKKRKPEDQLFFYGTFEEPLGDRAEDFQQALYYVRVGPSAQNKQPWRLVFSANFTQVHFYAASPLGTHPLYMCDPAYLDIGIAYNHFEAGLNELGITGNLVVEEPEIEKPEAYSYITTWRREP